MLRPEPSDRPDGDAFVPFERAHVEQSLARRFAWQVERSASRLAVRIGAESVTYGALDRWASCIANGLLDALGRGEEPVALLFDSDVTHVAAQLGVLKAGKICIPMDVTFPAARLSTMLADARVRVVLTDRAHQDQAAALCRASPGSEPVDVAALAKRGSDRDHGLDIAPDAIAYVFYTSGSTGAPKGVMQSHRNLLQAARVYTNAVELRPSDRVFCPMPLAYVGGVSGILASLMSGAAFCRGGVEAHADVVGQLIREEITVAQLMVSIFRNLLVSARARERFPNLRQVFTGGEVLYGADVERFREVFPANCGLLYDLGSTEAGFISFYRVAPLSSGAHPSSAAAAGQPVPAGYPSDDVEVLLLDDDLNPVPDGEVGQIAVRSEFLSPGYWRSPDRTGARFLADHAGAGRRIYLTGDLGRQLPDGCLVHLGRMDFETKIRGHRVAPEEIERALRALPEISDAAVVSSTDGRGDALLVAYVACQAAGQPTVSKVRRQLARSLPAHMVPSRFVFLEAFPLLPNGKLDRSALRPPEGLRPMLDVPFVAPRTPLEVLLAGMWAELLGVDHVGVEDDFLDHGGHSLLAMQLLYRIEAALGVRLPLREFFDNPTVAGMAAAMNRADRAPDLRVGKDGLESASVPGIRPYPRVPSSGSPPRDSK